MLVIGTMTTYLPSLTPMPTIPGEAAGPSSLNGIGGFILSSLNGGFPVPSTAGSGGSNQTQNNAGEGSVSAKPFLGNAQRIGLEWIIMGFVVMTVLIIGLGQNSGRI
ncbi:hypothetical protein N7G274_003408 [Stereocaulon virgatum]|uniref:Uncharacterized protein n=1 Tax=Stereocaulon virgatum TaxID=373712 RepID=A0ABR4ADQ1_9LECA